MAVTMLQLLVLAAGVLASENQPRQITDEAAFSSAASALISKYIPSADYAVLSASVASAASAATVTGDVNAIIYSALEATSAPGWFLSAVPTAYSTEVASLTAAIGSLRPSGSSAGGAVGGAAGGSGGSSTTAASGSMSGSMTGSMTGSMSGSMSGSPLQTPTVNATVVVVTGTDSKGSTFTSSYTTAVPAVTNTVVTTSPASGSGGTAAPKTGSSTSTGGAAIATPIAGLLAVFGMVAAL